MYRLILFFLSIAEFFTIEGIEDMFYCTSCYRFCFLVMTLFF